MIENSTFTCSTRYQYECDVSVTNAKVFLPRDALGAMRGAYAYSGPKMGFWGISPPKHFGLSSRPPKGTSLRETAHFDVQIFIIRYSLSCNMRYSLFIIMQFMPFAHFDVQIVKIDQPWRPAGEVKKQKKTKRKESHK